MFENRAMGSVWRHNFKIGVRDAHQHIRMGITTYYDIDRRVLDRFRILVGRLHIFNPLYLLGKCD